MAQVAQAALFSQLGKEQDDLKLEVEEPLVVVQTNNVDPGSIKPAPVYSKDTVNY